VSEDIDHMTAESSYGRNVGELELPSSEASSNLALFLGYRIDLRTSSATWTGQLAYLGRYGAFRPGALRWRKSDFILSAVVATSAEGLTVVIWVEFVFFLQLVHSHGFEACFPSP